LPKKYFIGAGLSALFAQLIHWQKGDLCIYSSGIHNPQNLRRPNLEINKFFSHKSKSFGSIIYKLGKAKLHDRNCPAGNSEIWGGFFDTHQILNLQKLHDINIKLIPLSYKGTGCISNIKSMVQLQDSDGRILNASKYLKPGEIKYLNEIDIKSKKISLKWIDSFRSWETEVNIDTKIFICIGVVQTIDLLIRSKIIKKGDELTLDEFRYNLNYGKISNKSFNNNSVIISYSTTRAIAHMLGLQKKPFGSGQQFFTINQYFLNQKRSLKLMIGFDKPSSSFLVESNKSQHIFGSSIHYCNLKINGERLMDVIKRLAPNIYFIGMASVSQKRPGPISSDIFKQIEGLYSEH
jgi:hypothetical protein